MTTTEKLRKDQIIGEILASARDAVERGVNHFDYFIKKDERELTRGIAADVRKASDSVRQVHRSTGKLWTWLKFSVKA
jgi:hypothetical protein